MVVSESRVCISIWSPSPQPHHICTSYLFLLYPPLSHHYIHVGSNSTNLTLFFSSQFSHKGRWNHWSMKACRCLTTLFTTGRVQIWVLK